MAAPACFAQTAPTTVCSPEEGRLSIQYFPQTDEGPEAYPAFPVRCKLGKVRYKVDAQQGPFSEQRCGAQPPWTMVAKEAAPLQEVPLTQDGLYKILTTH